jgi:hypothetical protein
MSTTKKTPSAAQLEARAKFTKMVKEKAAAKKKGLKAPATKEKEFLNSNLIFKGISRDTNGNKTVKLSFVNKSAFSIQTLGSLPKTHKLNKSDDLTQTQLNAIEKEVVAYIQNFGTITQKKGLKTYTGLKAPAKGVTTFCSKNIGVVGRRKKDGTLKKGYVAKRLRCKKKR